MPLTKMGTYRKMANELIELIKFGQVRRHIISVWVNLCDDATCRHKVQITTVEALHLLGSLRPNTEIVCWIDDHEIELGNGNS